MEAPPRESFFLFGLRGRPRGSWVVVDEVPRLTVGTHLRARRTMARKSSGAISGARTLTGSSGVLPAC